MSSRPPARRRAATRPRHTRASLGLEAMERRELLATFTVTSVMDNGAGTLREAINQANLNPGADNIRFNIPADQLDASDKASIQLDTPLPNINGSLVIDGSTQPGFGGEFPVVEVRPRIPQSLGDGFSISVGGSTIRSLGINRFGGNAINIFSNGNNTIFSNYIGVDFDGEGNLGNGGAGIRINNSSNNVIGGPNNENIIRYNGGDGIRITGDNIPSQGVPRSNLSINNRITYNTIDNNGGLGIDLGDNGVTNNDSATDSDVGPNFLQNFPEIVSATTIERNSFPQPTQRTEVEALLSSAANTTYLVQFFHSPAADPSGFGEGQTFFAAQQVTTDSSGFAQISLNLTNPDGIVPAGSVVTATATDPSGNTSEFSGALPITFDSNLFDLAVSLTDTPDPVAVGDVLTYEAVVTNFNRTSPSDPVTVQITLPNTVELKPGGIVTTAGDFTVDGNVITVNFGPVASFNDPSADPARVTITTLTTAPGVSVARAAIIEGDGNDPDTTDNTATTTTEITQPGSLSVLSFRLRDTTVSESGTVATIDVVRSNSLVGEVSVDYETADGTAVAGTDYITSQGTLTFAENEALKTFSVTILDDDQFDPNRTVGLFLGKPRAADPNLAAAVGQPNRATLTIFDNDPPTPPEEFLSFSQPSYSALENAGQAIVTVRRTGSTLGSVSVPFATVSGTAAAGQDFTTTSGTLTFLGGEETKDIGIPIADDAVLNGNRSFTVRLGAGIGAAVTDPSVTSVLIVDNEAPPPPVGGVFGFSSPDYTVGEGDGAATIRITRQGGTGPASINFQTADGSAVAGTRFQPVNATVDFAEGETEKTVQVPIIDAPGFQGTQSVNLLLTRPDQAGGAVATATLTILDNDTPPVGLFQFDPREVVVDESAGVATLTIFRAVGSTGAASVAVSTRAGDAVAGVDYQPIDTRVDFADGETSKTVSIPILDNFVIDGNRAFGVFLSDPQGNGAVGIPGSAVVVIANNDRDVTPPTVRDIRLDSLGGLPNSAVVITFSEAMAPGAALSASNYGVVALGRDGNFGTGDDRSIPIGRVEQSPDGTIVALFLAAPVPNGEFVAVGVNGNPGGLTDLAGNLVDGDGDGVAGGSFSTTLSRSNRVEYIDADGDRVILATFGGGGIEVFRNADGSANVVRIVDPVPFRTILRGRVIRARSGDGRATIGRIEGIDPFGRVRSALRTPPFIDLSQLTPSAVDDLLSPITLRRRGRS